MTLYTLPGHYGKNVELDACLACSALWLDGWESAQLSPDSIVALFRLISERGGSSGRSTDRVGQSLRCVSCSSAMRLVHDRALSSRFVYQACPKGHGRYMTFYNFLAEKQFVRELLPAERERLSVSVNQIKCSNCGAPVDLAKNDACGYCRAPIAVFDRDAAKKAIDRYLQQRSLPAHDAPPVPWAPVSWPQPASAERSSTSSWATADLASDILFALSRAVTRHEHRAAPAVLAGLGASANALPTATDALLGVGGAGIGAGLPEATQALFGHGVDLASASSLIDAMGAGSGGAIDAIASLGSGGEHAVASAGSLLANAADAGDGIVDLVADGIGSLLDSIFG